MTSRSTAWTCIRRCWKRPVRSRRKTIRWTAQLSWHPHAARPSHYGARCSTGISPVTSAPAADLALPGRRDPCRRLETAGILRGRPARIVQLEGRHWREHNLASAQPGKVKELQAQLVAWRKQLHAPMPTKNADIKLPKARGKGSDRSPRDDDVGDLLEAGSGPAKLTMTTMMELGEVLQKASLTRLPGM